MEDRRWHLLEYFEYTNRLIERSETRANLMLASNSLILIVYGIIFQVLIDRNRIESLTDWRAIILGIPALLMIWSIVLITGAAGPKVFSYDIPINHETVAKMTADEFRDLMLNRPIIELEDDYLQESHVLAAIFAAKSEQVKNATTLFRVALMLSPVALIVSIA